MNTQRINISIHTSGLTGSKPGQVRFSDFWGHALVCRLLIVNSFYNLVTKLSISDISGGFGCTSGGLN